MHPGWALTLSLAVAPQPGPSSPADSELLTELAAKVAAVVGTTTPPPTVSIDCSSNLRERVCTAEIGSGAARQVVMVTRPHGQAPRDATMTSIPVVLQLRPITAQSTPIMDVAIIGRRLLVLDPTAVTLYEGAGDGWRHVSSYPLATSAPWPRDVRGRLIVDGGAWEALIPGAACRGSLDPLRGTCTADQRPWPLGLENAGLVPGRNHFAMPDGRKYFNVAALDSAEARWMLAADEGKLLLLDEQRRPLDVPPLGGDDVAAFSTTCARGKQVAVAGRATDDADSIRVVRVAGREIGDTAAPVVLTGRITAMWPTPAGDAVLVVVRNPTTRRYEAFHAGLACGR